MSVLRLLFLCFLAVSLGVFVIYLESEKVKMCHQIFIWKQLEHKLKDQHVREFFMETKVLQDKVHGKSILKFLRFEKENAKKCIQ